MPRKSTFGKRLIASMTELVDALESGNRGRLTVRTVTRPADPSEYTAARVRATRQLLDASQTLFASLLGVSTVLVQSWEQGARKPSKLASRLLDEINDNPARWRKKLRTA